MANILEQYGIKEVCDFTLYDIGADGKPTVPVLYLDTLKVSTLEQTAEDTSAKGGKCNADLIMWDFGKEINITLEDALFSAKSMAIMFGNGTVTEYAGEAAYIMKTEKFVATDVSLPTEIKTTQSGGSGEQVGTGNYSDASGWSGKYTAPDGKLYNKKNPRFFDAKGAVVTSFTKGETYFCSFDVLVDGAIIDIGASTFPGTYYAVGDTFARSRTTGKDEEFQLIIPKAKVMSENTITMEAEGDPSVFNMNLRVLRPADGKMVRLVKYKLAGDGDAPGTETTSIYHATDLKTAAVAPAETAENTNSGNQ